jgi:protein TonB
MGVVRLSMKKILILSLVAAGLLLGAAPAAEPKVADIPDVALKVDEPPMPIKTLAPVYPEDLRQQGVSGVAMIAAVVDETGIVLAAEASKASHEQFKQPAIDAVKRWKFKPATLAGKAVKVRLNIPVKFTAVAE